ncbi:MAG: pyridoxamine 5'-phosphate oxidase [Bacteroidales bacterium]
MEPEDLSAFRREYRGNELTEETAGNDPFILFGKWLNEAIRSEAPDTTAMSLSTASLDGTVSSRIVLLKNYSEKGFTFFTNYNSRKGKQLAANPRAALLFYWPELNRQVRVEGKVERLPDEDSNRYFDSRPLESRMGAWISPQSQVIPHREYLEQKLTETGKKFSGSRIPRPSYWGGFRLVPRMIEFWQGREGRLHDRIVFNLSRRTWQRVRLAP